MFESRLVSVVVETQAMPVYLFHWMVPLCAPSLTKIRLRKYLLTDWLAIRNQTCRSAAPGILVCYDTRVRRDLRPWA